MARAFAYKFYHSSAWESTREAFITQADGLCQPCLAQGRITPGVIVHHKVHLSPENINDPSISLSFDNLELVCRDCHAKEHPEIYTSMNAARPQRVAFDPDGNVVRLPDEEE